MRIDQGRTGLVMTYRIEAKHSARHALLALPRAYRARIGAAIDALASDPRMPGTCQ